MVCTIEKANMILGRMLADAAIEQHDHEKPRLGAVIVDELHMVGDDDR